MKSVFKTTLFALLAAALLAGCASSTSAGAVGADRNQLMLYSADEMNEVANTQYAEVLAEAKKAGTLNRDEATYRRVQNVAERLIMQTPAFRSDALGWNWEVNVITEDTINAWCMPGGKIVVYTGIIEALNLTDGELAAVMGHEISHALKEHSREQASRETLAQLGIATVASVTNMGEVGQIALLLGAQYGLTLPFSRSNETEADNMGTELMARAGYDPNEAVNVWIKMNELGGGSVPEILSTHPSNNSRIENLRKVSQTVYPLYEAAK